MKRTKLHLHRQTLRPLTSAALAGVAGGETTDPPPAVKSYVGPTGAVEPCRRPASDRDC